MNFEKMTPEERAGYLRDLERREGRLDMFRDNIESLGVRRELSARCSLADFEAALRRHDLLFPDDSTRRLKGELERAGFTVTRTTKKRENVYMIEGLRRAPDAVQDTRELVRVLSAEDVAERGRDHDEMHARWGLDQPEDLENAERERDEYTRPTILLTNLAPYLVRREAIEPMPPEEPDEPRWVEVEDEYGQVFGVEAAGPPQYPPDAYEKRLSALVGTLKAGGFPVVDTEDGLAIRPAQWQPGGRW